jgi:hypothetical protein
MHIFLLTLTTRGIFVIYSNPARGTAIFSILFCSLKSTQTDAWQYGPEELNSLKRMRVSLPDTYLLILNCISVNTKKLSIRNQVKTILEMICCICLIHNIISAWRSITATY